MTNSEKRQAIANKVISREGKNQYTQSDKRYLVDQGYSDCSSLTQWAHEEVLGINIGDNTEAQINSNRLTTVDVPIKNGVPDQSYLLPADLLYFRGTNTGRKASQYVGHVEMYVGNGQLSGHGSGVGPTRKNMAEYCMKRQSQSSPVPAGNRGLICVRRAVTGDDTSDREYITSLYNTLLEREPDESGMNTWLNTLASGGTRNDVKNGILHSEEYKRKCQAYVTGLYETLLCRTPKEAEVNDWVQRMQGGMSKEEVRGGFTNSVEYRKNYVTSLYRDLLGREPKAEEVDSWVKCMNEGMSAEDVKLGFINSTEYRRNYVTNLYRDLLDREPKAEEVDSWVSEMANGMSADDVKLGFTNSTEYRRKYVKELYTTLLNRTPKDEEVESWVKCMAEGMSEEDVRLGFINSEEYKRKNQ